MEERFYFALPLNEKAHRILYSLDSFVSNIEQSEAQIVDFDCAIIVLPTSNQLGHLKDVLKDGFEETVSENAKYYEMVKRLVEVNGVKVISIAIDYLKLAGHKETWNLALRKDNLPSWNLIFFKTDKEPMIVPDSVLGIDLVREYFNVPKQK